MIQEIRRIVVGRKRAISRAGIAGLSIGNTAERMLGHLDCSLLTVKPADFVCPVRSGED